MYCQNAVLKEEALPADYTSQQTATPRDSDLVRAAKLGRSDAFYQLCGPLMKRLLKTAERITRNHEDAEDALQDSLLRALVHIKDFDGRSSFSTWLTRITINSALMLLRKRHKTCEISAVDEVSHEGGPEIWNLPDHAPSPEKQYSRRQRQQIITHAIENLRPTSRRVVQLQHLQELSLKETARELGVSVIATKSRLFHARAALRKSAALKAIARSHEEWAA